MMVVTIPFHLPNESYSLVPGFLLLDSRSLNLVTTRSTRAYCARLWMDPNVVTITSGLRHALGSERCRL